MGGVGSDSEVEWKVECEGNAQDAADRGALRLHTPINDTME